MTREEAISIMNVIVHMLEPQYDTDRIEDAVEMAIQALKSIDKIKEYEEKQEQTKRTCENCEHGYKRPKGWPCVDCLDEDRWEMKGDTE